MSRSTLPGNPDLPTVAFAVDLDIPDASFRQAEKVIAELAVSEPDIAAEVRLTE